MDNIKAISKELISSMFDKIKSYDNLNDSECFSICVNVSARILSLASTCVDDNKLEDFFNDLLTLIKNKREIIKKDEQNESTCRY